MIKPRQRRPHSDHQHAQTISATDAIVAAYADTRPEPLVLTSDAPDLTALAAHTRRRVTVARV